MPEKYYKITLEAARVNAHLTQNEAAEKLGVSRSTIQSWESGRTAPSVIQANRISEIYGWPKDAIFFA